MSREIANPNYVSDGRHWADRVLNATALSGGALIMLAACLTTYEVGMRYFFNEPTIWVMDASILAVLVAMFLSFAYALNQKAHVKVDFITSHLSPKTTVIVEMITTILALLYCGVMFVEGVRIAWKAYAMSELLPTIVKIPSFLPKSLIPIGAALLILQLVRQLFALPGQWQEAVRVAAGQPDGWDRAVPAAFIASLAFSLAMLKVAPSLSLLALFFVLLLSGIPVAFALGLFGVFGLYIAFGGAEMLPTVPIQAYATIDNSVIVAIPLFILVSNILQAGGIGERIYQFANTLVRHLPGGLAVATVIFCGLFSAMTGSSPAVAATVSPIALPEMLAKGYGKRFSIGLLAAGGTLGILFPPSLALMLYASMTSESIGELFMASLIPGLILSAIFCAYVIFVARRNPGIQREAPATVSEVLRATGGAAGGLMTIVIIMGGIYSGIFTPTESGAIAVVYATVLCIFVHRTLRFEQLKASLRNTARVSSMIVLIVVGANITAHVVLLAQIPQQILQLIASMDAAPWMVIALINVFLIILGAPLEAITILVIALPIVYPLVTALGYSGVWYAVVMIVIMELALISPPEGINLFILQDIAKATASDVTWGVMPFLAILAMFGVVISLFPELTLWLPSVLK